MERFTVNSPNCVYGPESIDSTFSHENTELEQGRDGQWIVTPTTTRYEFRTSTHVPKLGYIPAARSSMQPASKQVRELDRSPKDLSFVLTFCHNC